MKKQKLMAKLAVLSAVPMFMLVQPARAIPTLQLDASPGGYDSSSSTTISSSADFTLYALLGSLTPDAGASYYILAALQPPQSSAADLGSFVFNGTTIDATSGMTYGTPVSLPPHGVYPTYYSMIPFTWNTANTFNNYDVSLVTGAHTGPTSASPGNALYMGFDVNVSGLSAGESLWFDLIEYTDKTNHNDSVTMVENNEPFSHAGQSGGGSVPDGGSTLVLLGVAGLGLFAFVRKTQTT